MSCVVARDTCEHGCCEYTVFLCGDGVGYELVCECGRWADKLCDYPLGRGETCDAPLCGKCAVSPFDVGGDIHFCRVHAAMVGMRRRKKGGDRRG